MLDAVEMVTNIRYAPEYRNLFQGRSFDQLINHTTIVFSRYLVMEYEQQQSSDDRTLDRVFFLFPDEIRDLDYQTALQQLLIFFLKCLKQKRRRTNRLFFIKYRSGSPAYPATLRVCLAIKLRKLS